MSDDQEQHAEEPQETEGTTPEPAVPEPTPEPPDPLAGTPYAGKSAAELAKMVDDSQAFVKERSEELGQLRNENAYYRSQQQQPQPQAQPAQDFEDLDQRFLTNPGKTAMGLMDEKLNQFGMQSQYQQSQMMAPMVEQQASNTYAIFKSLDAPQRDEVRRYMMATTDPRSGMNPSFAMSPEAWANAASMVYMKSHNYSPPTASPNPVTPVATETPQATKPKEATGVLDGIPQKYRDEWSRKGYSAEQQERMAKAYEKAYVREGEK